MGYEFRGRVCNCSMDFFHYMDDLYFESYEQLLREIDAARAEMVYVDHNEIKQEPQILDLDNIKSLPDGRWDVVWETVKFECFFHGKKSTKLYVFLNGAITGTGATVPMFRRWSYYKFVDGSVINISDPMYRMYDKLKLGWYYGSEEFDLRQIVADFVLAVAVKIGVKKEDILFVGSSGGGCAAIACASYIQGAGSITINPQMVLSEYGYSTQFTVITGIDLNRKDRWNRNNTIYYLQNNIANTHFLFVNVRSVVDMQQVKNICNSLGVRVKYGLNVFLNLVIWLYDADMTPYISPHSLQENYCIWFVLEFIATNKDRIEKIKEYDSLVRLINEFYYDRRKIEREWRGKIPNLDCLRWCEHLDREVAIFGLGEYAELLNRELLNIEESNYYNIQYAIDNYVKKDELYHGLQIKHPSEIEDWKKVYIIITSERYCNQIRCQLEELGLVYERDFVTYRDLFK